MSGNAEDEESGKVSNRSAGSFRGGKAVRNPSTLLRAAARRVSGSTPDMHSNFDGLNGWGLSGWVWEPGRPDHRTRVGLYVDGSLISEQNADTFRADLLEAGIGDGAHAFRFDLSDLMEGDDDSSFVEDYTPRLIEVRIPSTGTPLNGPSIEMSPAMLFLSAAIGCYATQLSGAIEPVEFGDV